MSARHWPNKVKHLALTMYFNSSTISFKLLFPYFHKDFIKKKLFSYFGTSFLLCFGANVGWENDYMSHRKMYQLVRGDLKNCPPYLFFFPAGQPVLQSVLLFFSLLPVKRADRVRLESNARLLPFRRRPS